MQLQEYLHRHVKPEVFYRAEVENFVPGQNVVCPFHEDSSPSLSINTEGLGEYYCHSGKCNVHGTSFIGFYVQKYGVPYHEALKQIYAKYVRPLVPVDEVLSWHAQLLKMVPLQQWLLENRGVTLDTIRYYKLGFDGARVTIPIENQFDMVINARRYDVTRKAEAKMISYNKGYGRASLYPFEALRDDVIIIVEGEWDCILGRQNGLNCITSTGGAKYWNEEFSSCFTDKSVVILLDNDEAGHEGEKTIAASLARYAREVRIARYDVDGVDLTDYMLREPGALGKIKHLIASAELVSTSTEPKRRTIFERVRLQQAAHSSMRGRPIEFKAHVAGKDIQPYIIPSRVKMTCITQPENKCHACSGPEPYTCVMTLDPSDERILRFINASENQVQMILKKWLKCHNKCAIKIDVLESHNFEELKLVAPLDEVGEEGEFKYVMRTAVAKAYNIDSNATYIFRGYMYPDPETQHAVFLLVDFEHAADQLDRYALTTERKAELRNFFPGGHDVGRIHEFLDTTYEYLARRVSKIYLRRALHQAVDLAFHSALGFSFNNEFIRRGWLDVLIMGDTRTGKGYVTERLCRYYGVGEVASGENCTFAGLVGGVQQIGSRKSWAVTWGFLPRNDRRLVVIDEASAVGQDTLSRMSRVRSEGVAEVFKIVTERTLARTRTIWNANPSDGRSIREFEHGVEAVASITERKEDLARFDYAIVIASDEVSPAVINQLRQELPSEIPGFQQACRDLILWVWSRKPTQVIFDAKAVDIILTNAVELGKRYHHSIPLVQAENMREKLAKVAVAIAARVFSTDAEGEKIVVTAACASYAVGFFKYIYDSEVMAYDVYSSLQYERSTLVDEDELARMFAVYKSRANDWIGDLLENAHLSVKSIETSLNLDYQLAKEVRNKLAELRAIKAEHSYWVKREPFIKWLRTMRIKAIKNPDWWMEYNQSPTATPKL